MGRWQPSGLYQDNACSGWSVPATVKVAGVGVGRGGNNGPPCCVKQKLPGEGLYVGLVQGLEVGGKSVGCARTASAARCRLVMLAWHVWGEMGKRKVSRGRGVGC